MTMTMVLMMRPVMDADTDVDVDVDVDAATSIAGIIIVMATCRLLWPLFVVLRLICRRICVFEYIKKSVVISLGAFVSPVAANWRKLNLIYSR